MENNCEGSENVEVKSSTSPVTLGEGQGETTTQGTTNEAKGDTTSKKVLDSASTYGKNLWETLVSIWKKPTSGISNFLNTEKIELTYGMIGIHVLLLVITACIVLKRVFGVFTDFLGGLMSVLGEEIKLPYGKTIAVVVVGCFLFALIFAAVTMIVIKTYGKTECTYKRGLMVYGVKLTAVVPFILVTLIFSIFSIKLAVFFAILGELIGNVYVQTAVQCTVPQDDEKDKYSSFLVIGLNFIAFLLLCYLYFKL